MIPIRDNIPSRTVPFVNYTVIALCSLVFVAQLRDEDGAFLIERYGMIPARVLHPDRPVEIVDHEFVRTPFGIQVREIRREATEPAVPPWQTLLTCIFLHGGWMHIIGNMWMLWIFGDNVEDRLGHWGYVIFYLFCGVVASAAHLLSGPNSTAPTIGASGAIAGVMGAYLVLYPRAMVLSLVPIFFFIHMVVLPAPVFLGIWFLLQFFQGAFAVTNLQNAGVAWWAHIGGFAAGVAIAWILKNQDVTRPRVDRTRPNTDRMTHYRIHVRRTGE